MKNELDEFNLMNELYDLYGSLLTEKQKSVFENYYFFNLSLQEIADNLNISKAGVLDNLEHAKKNLLNYEECLKFNEKIFEIEKKDINSSIKEEIIDILRR